MRANLTQPRIISRPLLIAAICLAPVIGLSPTGAAVVDPLSNGPVTPDLFTASADAKPISRTAPVPRQRPPKKIRSVNFQTNARPPASGDAAQTLPPPAGAAAAPEDPCAAVPNKPLNQLGISIAEPAGKLPTDLADPAGPKSIRRAPSPAAGPSPPTTGKPPASTTARSISKKSTWNATDTNAATNVAAATNTASSRPHPPPTSSAPSPLFRITWPPTAPAITSTRSATIAPATAILGAVTGLPSTPSPPPQQAASGPASSSRFRRSGFGLTHTTALAAILPGLKSAAQARRLHHVTEINEEKKCQEMSGTISLWNHFPFCQKKIDRE